MSYIKAKGMVAREVAAGDYDKILTVITDDLGKISVSAKGARRSGNRYSAGTQIFSYCEWTLYKGKSMYILNSCDILNSFYQIREDLLLLAYAAHMLDMIQDTTYENQAAKEPLSLLLYGLNALSQKDRNPELIIRIFSLKLAQIMGFTPFLSGCCRCGTKDMDDIYFSYDYCGLICEKCCDNNKGVIQIKAGTAKALMYIICAGVREAFSFELSAEVLKNFAEVVDKYVGDRLERKYCKLSFLKEIKEKEYKIY